MGKTLPAEVRCFYLGTLSPNPWDLSLSRQNVTERAAYAAPAIPAASVLPLF